MDRANLDESGEVGGEAELLAGDGGGEVDADRRPELDPDRVLAGIEERADAEALLHPGKEELDLPALALELGDGGGRQVPMVGPRSQAYRLLQIVETDPAHQFGLVLGPVPAIETDRLVAAQHGGAIDWPGSRDVVPDVRPFPNEEGADLMDPSQAPQVDVAAIHEVEAAGLDRQIVQPDHAAVVDWRRGEKRQQRSPKVERSVEPHGRVAARPVGLRTQRQTQIDQRGVHRVARHLEGEHRRLVQVKQASPMHQLVGKGPSAGASPAPRWLGPACCGSPAAGSRDDRPAAGC